uniref:ATP synthase F0 subunit 8 n=1 Tax=Hystrichopsylla weida qinlingensis TaxID=2583743 RepID=A0A4P9JLD4_9NEOP|nr:ATP synthase F0 subunit 8 [Hystrichopsylla weida qinlingensis]QCU82651.1 ATP synthase F0 subunit 8 [Hystrichopsylla weida qinlingensis]
MTPMYWLILMLFFILIFMMFIIINYYSFKINNKLNTLDKNNKMLYKTKFNWKW